MLAQHLASISFVGRISDLFREMLVLNRGRHKEKFLESRYGFKYWPLLPGISQLKMHLKDELHILLVLIT